MAKRANQQTAFGRRLRILREARGLTQVEIGNAVGIQFQSIARYERGAVEPNWPTVLKFAAALGVTPNDFRDTEDAGDTGDTGKESGHSPTGGEER